LSKGLSHLDVEHTAATGQVVSPFIWHAISPHLNSLYDHYILLYICVRVNPVLHYQFHLLRRAEYKHIMVDDVIDQ